MALVSVQETNREEWLARACIPVRRLVANTAKGRTLAGLNPPPPGNTPPRHRPVAKLARSRNMS